MTTTHPPTPTPEVARALVNYVAAARENRPDWQAFAAEAQEDPVMVCIEIVEAYEDLHGEPTDDVIAEIFAVAQDWIRALGAPQPKHLAAVMVALVRSDAADDPDAFSAVTSWEELHSVVDANMYAMDAAEIFGLGDLEGEPLFAILNAATDLAAATLYGVEPKP